MPPVRQSPRPEPVWRDNDGPNRGGTPAQRWERPVSAEPRSPGSSGSGHIDRGSKTGTGAVVTPRTDASVTKTSETKSPETKPPPPERKPQ
jgi:hypothetical protein